ncbi:MAG TPA: pectate lyase [Bacteroidales bacterium]|nr:pectate lyase [Bacteroidales bacterium]
MKRSLITLLCSMLVVVLSMGQTLAFPGAEGGGKYTTGGRGGKVLYVTSLEDGDVSDVGTFRWAVSQHYPRIVEFKVSGVIHLKRKISIKQGDLTIAGQTAPGDGICIADQEVTIGADNIIMRYMRFRPGNESLGDGSGDAVDALNGRGLTNVIIDHCSMSWSVDECVSFYYCKNFTMQWCYITESLCEAGHSKGAHGYGGIWGGENASFHHNLLANHLSRNPRLNGFLRHGLKWQQWNNVSEERMDFRNNVIFNWGNNSCYGGEMNGHYNIVGNVYKAGMGTDPKKKFRITQVDIETEKWPDSIQTFGHGQYYIAENYVFGADIPEGDDWSMVDYKDGVKKKNVKQSQPYAHEPIPQHPVNPKTNPTTNLMMAVAAYGGANLKRDAVDTRIAQELMTGRSTYRGSVTGRWGILDKVADQGAYPTYNSLPAPVDSNDDGIPDDWFAANVPAGKTANDTNADGYTYVEVYINSLVEACTAHQYDGTTYK